MFNGSRVVHEGGHGVTDRRMPCVARLGCNTEVGQPEPGNRCGLDRVVISEVPRHNPGMEIEHAVDNEEQEENNEKYFRRPHDFLYAGIVKIPAG